MAELDRSLLDRAAHAAYPELGDISGPAVERGLRTLPEALSRGVFRHRGRGDVRPTPQHRVPVSGGAAGAVHSSVYRSA